MMKLGVIFLTIIAASSLCFAQTVVSTYAGNGAPGSMNGNIDSATFNDPFGLCRDTAGNLYVVEAGNNDIRKITPDGVVTTLVTGFSSPSDACVDDSGNVYLSDFAEHFIKKITPQGVMSFIAGSGYPGYTDTTGFFAQFDYPRGIVRDKNGNLYVADSWNHRIRKITPAGMVTTFAGGGNSMGVQSVGDYKDGQDTSARFYTPSGLAIDDTGNIYVADAYNQRIRKITPGGYVSTIGGNGAPGPGKGGYMDGAKDIALFNTPTELCVDAQGNVYVSDTFGERIRKIAPDGTVSTIAGDGSVGFRDSIGAYAEFNYPRGIVFDGKNTFYVNDYNNHSIRKIVMGGSSAVRDQQVIPVSALTVYPNPGEGNYSFSCAECMQKNVTFEVVNPLGQVVYKAAGGSATVAFTLPSLLAPGMYTLVVHNGNLRNVQEFILR
jgi:sugar lactone lactonase YvrE